MPKLDRSYRNFSGAWEGFHDVIRKSYVEAFDEATADELMRYPLINSSVSPEAAGGLPAELVQLDLPSCSVAAGCGERRTHRAGAALSAARDRASHDVDEGGICLQALMFSP